MSSFYTLMQQNLAYQRDQLDLTDEQFWDLHKDMACKVDAYHDYTDFLKSEEERYKAQAKTLTDRARIASNLRERLLGNATITLAMNDDRDAMGDVWRMYVKKSRAVKLLTDITYDVYAKLAMDNPDLFSVEYKISKAKLKELLENPECSQAIKDIAEFEERKSADFKPKRIEK